MFKQSFFFFFTLKHSQAVQAGNVLYVSGSLGLDKKPLKPVEGGTAAKARQSRYKACLQQISHILWHFKNVSVVKRFNILHGPLVVLSDEINGNTLTTKTA